MHSSTITTRVACPRAIDGRVAEGASGLAAAGITAASADWPFDVVDSSGTTRLGCKTNASKNGDAAGECPFRDSAVPARPGTVEEMGWREDLERRQQPTRRVAPAPQPPCPDCAANRTIQTIDRALFCPSCGHIWKPIAGRVGFTRDDTN